MGTSKRKTSAHEPTDYLFQLSLSGLDPTGLDAMLIVRARQSWEEFEENLQKAAPRIAQLRPNSKSKKPAEAEPGAAAPPTPDQPAEPELLCPKCGAGLYDNRKDPDLAAHPTRPLLKCKNPRCDYREWQKPAPDATRGGGANVARR